MKRALVAIASITLFSSSVLSQGMRDTMREYNSSEQCFSEKRGGKKEVCLYGNGNIHYCFFVQTGDCTDGFVDGKINRRMRVDSVTYTELTEYYMEGGNLVKYSCVEGVYMQCDGRPEKVVYYPL